MFTPDFYIESVQNARKVVVNTFVKDEAFRTELVKLIDAQTKFTKTIVGNYLELAQTAIKGYSDILYKKA